MDLYKQNAVLAEHLAAEKGKKRASFEIRLDHIIEDQAVPVTLIVPATYVAMPGTWSTTLDGVPYQVPALKQLNTTRDAFDKVQRKLYRVTEEGCLIPHFSWAKRGEGNTNKGYQLMMDAYYGWRPAGGGRGVAEVTNSFGWSEVLQASHLCHNGPMCCNPCHVIAESRWRNLKRNYCGSNNFVCDCVQGLSPPYNTFSCLNIYRTREISDLTFVTEPDDIREALNILQCPGFFQPVAGQLPAVPIANRFVENVHWRFLSDDEIARFASADALAATKLKRARTKV